MISSRDPTRVDQDSFPSRVMIFGTAGFFMVLMLYLLGAPLIERLFPCRCTKLGFGNCRGGHHAPAQLPHPAPRCIEIGAPKVHLHKGYSIRLALRVELSQEVHSLPSEEGRVKVEHGKARFTLRLVPTPPVKRSKLGPSCPEQPHQQEQPYC